MFNSIIHTFKYGKNLIKIETGILSKQTTSSILISIDNDTVILVSIVEKNQKIFTNQIFIPLTVNYYERSYALGKIPGNFIRRETRPSENEILISRLIDRSIRSLFDDNYFNEVQVTVTLVSLNPEINPDIISIIGVSAAFSISKIPIHGPISSSRVGLINGNFILNPNILEMKHSELDLVVSGTDKSITMIECMSNFLSKDIILNAIKFGYENYCVVIENIKKFTENVIEDNTIFEKENNIVKDLSLYNLLSEITFDQLNIAYSITDKYNRTLEIDKIKNNALNQINNILSDNQNLNILINLNKIEKKIVRKKIIENKKRIDGRSYSSVRNIYTKIGLLPRAHGSSLFIRGDTQALVSITLGNEKDGQLVNNYIEEYIDKFIFHYNFPSYSVGEISNSNFPKRREIGHAKLAKKSLINSIININNFPYTIRIVSEITESNGSSSMASICGASLALMDAGVPIKHPIAGIAMGLIKEKNNTIILSDISGYEDSFGDLDFKIAGNKNKITAIQMDLKIKSISIDLIENIIDQALINIDYIINCMDKTISCSKKELSKFSPKFYTLNINKNKIKDLIGKGGSVIKSIIKNTRSSIDIDDNGNIKIYAINNELGEKTISKIKEITSDILEGITYKGIITRLSNFGIFVFINNRKEGLINFSKINNLKKDKLNKLKIGQEIYVKIIEIDKYGKIQLSIIE